METWEYLKPHFKGKIRLDLNHHIDLMVSMNASSMVDCGSILSQVRPKTLKFVLAVSKHRAFRS